MCANFVTSCEMVLLGVNSISSLWICACFNKHQSIVRCGQLFQFCMFVLEAEKQNLWDGIQWNKKCFQKQPALDSIDI